MTEHKHAELFRAIAAGDDLSQWECVSGTNTQWQSVKLHLLTLADCSCKWQVRRKPKTIRIGDMDVPEPMRVEPADMTSVWAVIFSDEPIKFLWQGGLFSVNWLKYGMCQATEEGARLHREALIKVSGGTV